MPINCELLESYKFIIAGKNKVFCPNCFKLLTESGMNKHFGGCAEVLNGRKRFKEDKKIILETWEDSLFRSFLRRFNKFLKEYTSEFRGIPYSKNYDYWILQYDDPNFRKLLIGLAYVRFNEDMDKFILPMVVIFPKNNLKKGYAKYFIKKINEFYKKYGEIIIESPNEISLKIVKKLKLDFYYHL